MGIAGELLRELVQEAINVASDCGLGRLVSVYAHVWETNDVGLDWYTAHGFTAGDIIKGYYRKLRPDGARIVRRGIVGLSIDRASMQHSEDRP